MFKCLVMFEKRCLGECTRPECRLVWISRRDCGSYWAGSGRCSESQAEREEEEEEEESFTSAEGTE